MSKYNLQMPQMFSLQEYSGALRRPANASNLEHSLKSRSVQSGDIQQERPVLYRALLPQEEEYER